MHVNPPPPAPKKVWQTATVTIHVYLKFYEKYTISNMANVLTIQPPS